MSEFVTIEDVRVICFAYAESELGFEEPLPPFETRYPGRLESALHAPQLSNYGTLAHETIAAQAAVLFYEMNKLHPFVNGNKRIACVTLAVFLALNRQLMKMNWRELYDLALDVASSPTDHRGDKLRELSSFIAERLHPFESNDLDN